MKVTKVKGFICPECNEFIVASDVESSIMFQCGECDELYDDLEEAKECCKED